MDKQNGALGNLFPQRNLDNRAKLEGLLCHGLRKKGQAKIVLHHGEDLIRGGGFGVRREFQMVRGKQLAEEPKTHGFAPKADQGIVFQLRQRKLLTGQSGEGL